MFEAVRGVPVQGCPDLRQMRHWKQRICNSCRLPPRRCRIFEELLENIYASSHPPLCAVLALDATLRPET